MNDHDTRLLIVLNKSLIEVSVGHEVSDRLHDAHSDGSKKS